MQEHPNCLNYLSACVSLATQTNLCTYGSCLRRSSLFSRAGRLPTPLSPYGPYLLLGLLAPKLTGHDRPGQAAIPLDHIMLSFFLFFFFRGVILKY